MATVEGAGSLGPEGRRSHLAAGTSYGVEMLRDTALRRCVDVSLAVIGLVVLSPVLAVLMLAVKLTSPGPALYLQTRVGRGQAEFAIVKLRTMVIGSDRQGLVTASHDPRLTSLGRLLRGCRLDELPQLVNLLRGEMTLIGPRPEVPRFLPYYSERERALFRVRPGVIGPGALLFATRQEHELDRAEDADAAYVENHLHPKLRLDLDYLLNRSLWHDVQLLLVTAWVVITRTDPVTARDTARSWALSGRLRRTLGVTAVTVLVLGLAAGGGTGLGLGTWLPHPHTGADPVPAEQPVRDPGPLHYAANGNFTADSHYTPRRLGFTMADVSTRARLRALPSGVKALVYLGTCRGVDRRFIARARPFLRSPRVFGFYVIDEPDLKTCPPRRLKQESTWLHRHAPGTRTFIIVRNRSSSRHPSFRGGYTHQNSGIDLFGVDPYPCRSELHGCDMSMIGAYVRAAEASGIPRARMVPVYQAFGGGAWEDDGGGHFVLPTPQQARRLLKRWASLVPDPVFDFVYSWGQQRGDRSLSAAKPALQEVFAAHNRGDGP